MFINSSESDHYPNLSINGVSGKPGAVQVSYNQISARWII